MKKWDTPCRSYLITNQNNVMTIRIIILFLLFTNVYSLQSQSHLFGKVPLDSLRKFDWYQKNAEKYTSDTEVIMKLKKQKLDEYSIKVFFGTWCGDTKRELPVLMKVLNEISFPLEKISFYAVSSADSIYKQCKLREEKGLNIFRVGTFIIEKNGVEINRIVEFPKYSMEVDLLKIISGEPYTPQYAAYSKIIEWLNNGTLSSKNISGYNLASHLRGSVSYYGELNACGYVLLADKKYIEAQKVFQINTVLFPEKSEVWHSLAEAHFKMDQKIQAIWCIDQGLRINKSTELVKEFLDLHEKVVMLK